jgi:16S rRNA (cytidine1402-2'-O)-methyltransferase
MKLIVVPTPIGNLGDITLRALETLKEVDAIVAEDTRTTGNLLRHFEIQKPLTSFHTHNEHKVAERIAERIEAGQTLALVSDAGTPGISDPGFLLWNVYRGLLLLFPHL